MNPGKQETMSKEDAILTINNYRLLPIGKLTYQYFKDRVGYNEIDPLVLLNLMEAYMRGYNEGRLEHV